mmetsp:Transcript_31895/g.93737  ORF Transcript_31895/g.93737 Transcript_31895/m.93737 type:complete len:226 (-) Transcript_31895:102-779(-)
MAREMPFRWTTSVSSAPVAVAAPILLVLPPSVEACCCWWWCCGWPDTGAIAGAFFRTLLAPSPPLPEYPILARSFIPMPLVCFSHVPRLGSRFLLLAAAIAAMGDDAAPRRRPRPADAADEDETKEDREGMASAAAAGAEAAPRPGPPLPPPPAPIPRPRPNVVGTSACSCDCEGSALVVPATGALSMPTANLVLLLLKPPPPPPPPFRRPAPSPHMPTRALSAP